MKKIAAVLLLAGCAPLETFQTPVHPIKQEMCVILQLDTEEEIAKANNYGIAPSGGGPVIMGRYWSMAKPYPRITAPLATDSFDRRAFCILGHEMYHGPFGDFHTDDLIDACE